MRQRLKHADRGWDGGPALGASLNNAALLLWWFRLPPQAFPFAELLPPSCPLTMSPHSQPQSSAWISSPNPTFQHPAFVCSGGHPSQAWGAGLWLVPSVEVSLSCLPLAGTASSSHKRMRLPSVPVSSPKGCRSHLTSSPHQFPSCFFGPTWL